MKNANTNIEMISILLVDDDPEDVELTLEVMKMNKVQLKVEVAKNGLEALEVLNRHANNGVSNLPDLILLDLNMPKMNGLEVLEHIKKDRKLKRIPVVVLTTSKSETDISKSYESGVSCFITKPVGLNEFQDVVEAINNFWFTVVKFPE